jgi:hypothetical protein
MRNTYKISVGIYERKKELGRFKRELKDNIKNRNRSFRMCTIFSRGWRPIKSSSENNNEENVDKRENFFDQLSNNTFTKKGYISVVPCNIRQNPCFAWKFKMVSQSATDIKRFGKGTITVYF